MRARADLAGIPGGPTEYKPGAFMVIMADGKVVSSVQVRATQFHNDTFTWPHGVADPIPLVAKPTAKATRLATPGDIDPLDGTRVYKATQASDFLGASMIRHEYSRRPAFNAHNRRSLAQTRNGCWLLYDGANFKRLTRSGSNGALKGMAGDGEPIWYRTDPTKVWYSGQNEGVVRYEKNVETDVDTVMADFTGRLPWPQPPSVWTQSGGTSSADGCSFAFMASSCDNSTKQNKVHGLFSHDSVTNKIVGTLDASAFSGHGPDHISMSPRGQYVVPSWAFFPALGTRAYPLDRRVATKRRSACASV